MATAYSTLMGLAEPVQGELSGTWGDTVNKGITEYLDVALAGTQTISGSQTAVTLSLTNGNASATNIAQAGSGATGSAQFAIINCTGNPGSLLTITVPASSRQYIVINATSTSQSVKVVGVGPTTGVTIAAGRAAHIAWNGSDFTLVATTDASKLSGILAVANGGTGLSSGTSGGVPYFSGSTTIASSAALAANALVVGGGAGAAPSTVTTGTGVVTAIGNNTNSANGLAVLNASGLLNVAQGGTGASTLTANNVILGNGTSAVQFVAPGTNGNVLTSNGTTWTSAAPAATLSGQTDSASPFETSLGYQAGNVTTGVANTWVGYQAGLSTTSGTDNSALGYWALYSNTTGGSNTAIGKAALQTNLTGSRNTAVGWEALNNTTVSDITAVGYRALKANTTGSSNTAVGSSALYANTTGADNTAVGFQALDANTTGTQNIAMGSNALGLNTTASDNTAIGFNSLDANTTGSSNVALGSNSLGANTTANYNTAVGHLALFRSTTGSDQTAIGYNALAQVTTGSQNTAIGYQAGATGVNDLTTGVNNIIIGHNAEASSATVSNEVTLGNTSITSTRLRGMVQVNAAMLEQATVSATAATGTINFDSLTQSVLYYTSNASANWTVNFRASSGTSLNTAMATGQSLTVAFLVTQGATAYYNSAVQVDGASVTPKWQGGTAPTAGNASSVDIYVYTIIKTGSATFSVFASQTKFA